MVENDVDADAVLFERIGTSIAVVTLNRPEKRNAVNGAVTRGLEKAVEQVESDPLIRVAILKAAGDKSFCAGADLAMISAGREAELNTEKGGFAGFVRANRMKPWIAAVAANALGGGLELCLACDMIVAGSGARFGLPEVKRGLFAAAAGTFRLPRRIPVSIALEMLATGDPIDAGRAYSLGLVNRVVEDSLVIDCALELARAIAENAPLAVGHSLVLARAAADKSEKELWELNQSAMTIVFGSEDAKEGPLAFFEKRKANWLAR